MDSWLEIVPHFDVGSLLAGAWSLLLDSSLKATVVLGVTAVITALLAERVSAATRYSVWRLAVVAVLAIPAMSPLLPRWDVDWLPTSPWADRFFVAPTMGGDELAAPEAVAGSGSGVLDVIAPVVIGASPAALAAGRASAASVGLGHGETPTVTGLGVGQTRARHAVSVAPVERDTRITALGLALTLWWLGASALIALLLAGMAHVWRITRAARPVSDPSCRDLAAGIAARLDLRRPVSILQSPTAAMPMTWGVWRPLVLLPECAATWSRERLLAVLNHELAHIKRHDYLMQLVTRYACAVYWFHPLMWLAARRMRLERERACDDAVLSAGSKPSAYAGHLLDIARSLRSPFSGFAGVAMARPSHLADRLAAVLDDSRNRNGLSRLASASTWLIAASLVIPLACVRTTPQPLDVNPAPPPDRASETLATASVGVARSVIAASPSRAVANGAGSASSISVATPRRSAQVSTWASSPRCAEVDRGEGRHGSQSNVNDDRRTLRWWDDDCEGEMRSRGRVEFNRDFSDVASVSSDGSFSLQIDDGDVERRVEIRMGRDGSVERRWFEDGGELPYDGASQQWFTLALQDLFRHSAFKLDERVVYIVDQRGVDGLLQEAEVSHGGYLKRRFFTAAIETGMLSSQQIEQLLERAAVGVDSDHELARLLMSVPADAMRDDGLRRTYLRVSAEIDSDFEKRRVLSEMLTQENPSDDLVIQLLDAAGGLESDHELSRLLQEIGPAYLGNDNVRAAYLTTADAVESDFERRRVLDELLGQEDLSPEILVALLRAAVSIESDHELSRLLTGTAKQYFIDETLRSEFFRAVGTVDSDFERGRILRTVIDGRDVSPAVLDAVMESARQLGSDHELARLLDRVSDTHGVDDTLAEGFFAAVASIESDHERRGVLTKLARRNDTSRGIVLRILDAARGIDGDNAKASVMLVVAREHADDEEVRAALMALVDTVESDHEYSRLMRALRR